MLRVWIWILDLPWIRGDILLRILSLLKPPLAHCDSDIPFPFRTSPSSHTGTAHFAPAATETEILQASLLFLLE